MNEEQATVVDATLITNNNPVVEENINQQFDLRVGDPPTTIQYKLNDLAYTVNIRRIKLYVYVCHGAKHDIVKAKLVDDHYLKFKVNGKKKKVLIASQPALLTSRYKVLKKKVGLVWGCGFRAEATHDLGATQRDIVAIENILKYVQSITDSEIPKVLAEKVKSSKKLLDYLPWILFFLTNLAWMYYTADLVAKLTKVIGGS